MRREVSISQLVKQIDGQGRCREISSMMGWTETEIDNNMEHCKSWASTRGWGLQECSTGIYEYDPKIIITRGRDIVVETVCTSDLLIDIMLFSLLLLLKGAEANLYTFREEPVFEGKQICFRTLYYTTA